jgi:2-polyprenyl-3-methyl-5-hydroxy-6-metoxy-1,4-benzoquinol methylase
MTEPPAIAAGSWDPARAASFFDEHSVQEWERSENGRTPAASLEIHHALLRRFVGHGDRVLDAGAGPGRFTVELARLGADVVALALSPVVEVAA